MLKNGEYYCDNCNEKMWPNGGEPKWARIQTVHYCCKIDASNVYRPNSWRPTDTHPEPWKEDEQPHRQKPRGAA